MDLCFFHLILSALFCRTEHRRHSNLPKKYASFPERKRNLADDINRYYNADNLWDALRAEFVLPHYENNPLVQEQIEWFMNHQDFLLHSTTRAAPYLYYIFQQVKKRHLPAELVLLPIIESAYNPFAYSSAGAAGIWQMMPGTASGYGVNKIGGTMEGAMWLPQLMQP